MKTAFFPFAITAVTYLFLGGWIILRHKNKAQRLYGALCIATCFWQGLWAILFSGMPSNAYNLWIRVGYTGVVLIPPVFYHFIIEFTQRETHRYWLRGFYFTSGLLVVLIWSGNYFVNDVNSYSWGLSARAGLLHPMFIVLIGVVVVRMLRFLWLVARDKTATMLRKRQAILIFAALSLYAVSSVDLISNYGVSVFPVSCVFTGIAFMLFSYAIFRYELLAITASTESEDEKLRRIAISHEMEKLEMAAAFPLVSQGEVLGYLLLGEKKSEEAYSREDLLLLRIVANQAALAYQRVRYLEMAVRGARTEMLGEIAGGFAHEIKTPLANISLPAELCFIDLTDIEQGKRKIEDVLPELKQRMKDIMQQTFKASDKIEAIRQFSKPGQIHLESVEIGKVLQNSISLLDHLLHKAAINMKVELASVIPLVRGNAKQLEIVFVNLIKNAAEAMVSGNPNGLARNLSLKSTDEGNWVVISVKDSGPGMKRTDVGHLFEAYFTTKGSSGTGMGLFLSHQVVKAHGGSIEVKSEEGKGTEFVVRLPKYTSVNDAGVHKAA